MAKGDDIDWKKPYRIVVGPGFQIFEAEQLPESTKEAPAELPEDKVEAGTESLDRLVEMGVVRPTSEKKLRLRKEKP